MRAKPPYLSLLLLIACQTGGSPRPADAVAQTQDAEARDASTAQDVASSDAQESLSCRGQLGNALAEGFGRLDGFLRSVALTHDTRCPSDDNHIRLQVEMLGEHYEAWINVESTFGSDRRVYMAETNAPLHGGAWSEGWHTLGVDLSYPTTLGIASDQLLPMTRDEINEHFATEVQPGFPVSIYLEAFDSSGGHKVHRNNAGPDGALVTYARARPRYHLFRFANQSF